MKAIYRCMHCGQVYSGYFCPKCGRVNPNLTSETERVSKPLLKRLLRYFFRKNSNKR